jgi:hypothetical protein
MRKGKDMEPDPEKAQKHPDPDPQHCPKPLLFITIFSLLTKKFELSRFGMFYFKQTRLEDGRFTFTRALQSLDKRDVAETAVKFAQIEFKYGDAERGKKLT